MFYRRDLRSVKKRGSGVGKTKKGKGTKVMAIADAQGFPVAICTESAEPHEIRLVTETIEQMVTKGLPELLIGDKAYDSDVLDTELAAYYGIKLIAPHKINRKRPSSQDGRQLRRYKKRWKIERLFSWFNHFRRILIRWEYYLSNFYGFVLLACIVILLRHL